MKKSIIFKMPIVLLSCVTSHAAFASKLEVKNENNKDLIVYIQAEGSASEDLHWMEVTVPANSTQTVNVTDKDMAGKQTYFVRGRTNPITPRGTCANLSIDKNYKVTFKNLNVGTECVSELIDANKGK